MVHLSFELTDVGRRDVPTTVASGHRVPFFPLLLSLFEHQIPSVGFIAVPFFPTRVALEVFSCMSKIERTTVRQALQAMLLRRHLMSSQSLSRNPFASTPSRPSHPRAQQKKNERKKKSSGEVGSAAKTNRILENDLTRLGMGFDLVHNKRAQCFCDFGVRHCQLHRSDGYKISPNLGTISTRICATRGLILRLFENSMMVYSNCPSFEVGK